MKKILIMILFLLLLTGCTVNYELNINDDSLEERISGTVDKNEYEIDENDTSYKLAYTLIEFDQPALYGTEEFYTKKINKNKNNIDYNYKYTYKNNIEKSNILNSCFENHIIEETEDYYHINLSGEFYCLYSDKVDINVISNMKVIKTNGNKIDNNKYNWIIDNSDNVNIIFDVSKIMANDNEKAKLKINIFQIIGFIIIVILSILVYFLYKKKNNSD